MITISALAQRKLEEYLKENNISSFLRVAVMPGGCSGPALGLALDEQKKDDLVTTAESLTLLISKDLSEQCGAVSVDFMEAGSRSGFSITSAHPIPGAGGCGSGSCGSSGCGC